MELREHHQILLVRNTTTLVLGFSILRGPATLVLGLSILRGPVAVILLFLFPWEHISFTVLQQLPEGVLYACSVFSLEPFASWAAFQLILTEGVHAQGTL